MIPDCSNNNRPDYEYVRLFNTALLIYYGYVVWVGRDQSSSISSRAPYWLSTGLVRDRRIRKKKRTGRVQGVIGGEFGLGLHSIWSYIHTFLGFYESNAFRS